MAEVNREDFDITPERPVSIREIVENELAFTTINNKTYPKPESVDDLLEKVFEHIEREALRVFKSNEPWALKAWAYSNIFKEAVVEEGNSLLKQRMIREANTPMVEELVSPIIDWQDKQPFDPISHYKRRLTFTLRKSEATVKAYMVTASRFVAKVGRSKVYTDDDVMEYLDWAGEHFKEKKSSYIHECHRLQQFLRSLPPVEKNRDRKLPINIEKLESIQEWHQEFFTDEEVELLCWACVFDPIKPNMVARIFIASIYGGRKGELGQMSSDDVHITENGEGSYIFIPTSKGGARKQQPLPKSLVPLLSMPFEPAKHPTLHNRLKRIVVRAGIPWRYGMGFHAIRRNVVTLIDHTSQSDLNKHKFMRWATPRQFSMLERYRQTPQEESDMAILKVHPRVEMWKVIIPYLFESNPYYKNNTYVKIHNNNPVARESGERSC